MQIRLMTLNDYNAAITLWKNTAGIGISDRDDTRNSIARYLARNPSTCFVAEENGRLIGTVLAGHDGRRGFIYHAAVADFARGRGVGSALIAHVTGALQREGIGKAALLAMQSNTGGNAFWEKQGFVERPDLCYRNREL